MIAVTRAVDGERVQVLVGEITRISRADSGGISGTLSAETAIALRGGGELLVTEPLARVRSMRSAALLRAGEIEVVHLVEVA